MRGKRGQRRRRQRKREKEREREREKERERERERDGTPALRFNHVLNFGWSSHSIASYHESLREALSLEVDER